MGDPAGIAALKSHDACATVKIANRAVENLVHRTAGVALKEDKCKTTEERGAYQLNSLREVVVTTSVLSVPHWAFMTAKLSTGQETWQLSITSTTYLQCSIQS
jgi:hypothetical protein